MVKVFRSRLRTSRARGGSAAVGDSRPQAGTNGGFYLVLNVRSSQIHSGRVLRKTYSIAIGFAAYSDRL